MPREAPKYQNHCNHKLGLFLGTVKDKRDQEVDCYLWRGDQGHFHTCIRWGDEPSQYNSDGEAVRALGSMEAFYGSQVYALFRDALSKTLKESS